MASSKCAWCNSSPPAQLKNASFKVCSVCKVTSYCSTECQKADWIYHNLVCKNFAVFISLTPRPSPHHKVALILPANKLKPKLFWMEFNQHLGRPETWEDPDCRPHLGPQYTGRERISLSRQLRGKHPQIRRFALDHTIDLYVRDRFAYDGSKSNACVWNLISRPPGFDWKGPMIVLCMPGVQAAAPFFQDFKPSDLRIVAEFFKRYVRENPEPRFHHSLDTLYTHLPGVANVQDPPRAIKGVNINCDGGYELLSEIQFTQTEIDHDHAIFTDTLPSSISVHMGLPLLLRKYELLKLFPTPGENCTFRQNNTALFLNLNADPRSGKWAFAPEEWDSQVGPVLVLRQDGKNITPQQVESLAHFCRYELAPVMKKLDEGLWHLYVRGDATQDEMCQAKENFVKLSMCRSKFEGFWEKFKASKIEEGNMRWKWAVSPYQV